MKKLFIFGILLMQMSIVFGQFQMTNVGKVGIGTTSPQGQLEVHGDGLWLTFNQHTFRFKPNNPGTEIGSSDGNINFWYTTNAWNTLCAGAFYAYSDSTGKNNINPIKNGLSSVLQFKGYSYTLRNDSSANPRIYYGFLAQDLQSVSTYFVDSAKNQLLVNYNEIIPFLVEAVKTQNNTIDSLKIQLDSINNEIKLAQSYISGIIENCCPIMVNQIRDSLKESKQGLENNIMRNMLFQNNPNPFSNYTTIKYFLTESYSNSKIELYDMNGNKVKTIYNLSKGLGEIRINVTELQPGAFTYILIINNNVIDSKILIITK